MPTLYVDADTGNDGRDYVDAQDPSTPFATPMRALRGNADRENPEPDEAAQEGDEVHIQGSADLNAPTLYTTNAAVTSNSTPVYLPINSGELASPITIRPIGFVKFGAPAANGPLFGNSGSIDHIRWLATRSTGRFIVVCDGRLGPARTITGSTPLGGNTLRITTLTSHGYTTGNVVRIRYHDSTPPIGDTISDEFFTVTVLNATQFTISDNATVGGTTGVVQLRDDVKSDDSIVNTKSDSGPCFFTGTGFQATGWDVDGGELIDYGDNWEGFRGTNATDFLLKNCWVKNFRALNFLGDAEATSHNQTGITLYGAQNGLIENMLLQDNGAGLYFKDTAFFNPTFGNRFRRSWVTGLNVKNAGGVSKGVAWSLVQTGFGHDKNFIGELVLVDLNHVLSFNAPCWGDDIYNITAARCEVGLDNPFAGVGVRINNSVFFDIGTIIQQESVNAPASTAVDWQHNSYRGFTTFLADNSGNHTFQQWKDEYTDQDVDNPDSIDIDPELTDPDNDDFTLQPSSPCRDLGVDIGDVDGDLSTVDSCHAGAYQNPDDVIGLEDDDDEIVGPSKTASMWGGA